MRSRAEDHDGRLGRLVRTAVGIVVVDRLAVRLERGPHGQDPVLVRAPVVPLHVAAGRAVPAGVVDEVPEELVRYEVIGREARDDWLVETEHRKCALFE